MRRGTSVSVAVQLAPTDCWAFQPPSSSSSSPKPWPTLRRLAQGEWYILSLSSAGQCPALQGPCTGVNAPLMWLMAPRCSLNPLSTSQAPLHAYRAQLSSNVPTFQPSHDFIIFMDWDCILMSTFGSSLNWMWIFDNFVSRAFWKIRGIFYRSSRHPRNPIQDQGRNTFHPTPRNAFSVRWFVTFLRNWEYFLDYFSVFWVFLGYAMLALQLIYMRPVYFSDIVINVFFILYLGGKLQRSRWVTVIRSRIKEEALFRT